MQPSYILPSGEPVQDVVHIAGDVVEFKYAAHKSIVRNPGSLVRQPESQHSVEPWPGRSGESGSDSVGDALVAAILRDEVHCGGFIDREDIGCW